MATNPLVDQGVLNRIIGSIIIPNFPALNVTAPFLGREGIRLALDGEATLYIPTMTGATRSEEPYMMITCTAHLLKPQNLSDQYKKKMESDSFLGGLTVRPDVSTGLSPYDLLNCSVNGVRELNFSGDDAGYAVAIRGYYNVNSDLWNQF